MLGRLCEVEPVGFQVVGEVHHFLDCPFNIEPEGNQPSEFPWSGPEGVVEFICFRVGLPMGSLCSLYLM